MEMSDKTESHKSNSGVPNIVLCEDCKLLDTMDCPIKFALVMKNKDFSASTCVAPGGCCAFGIKRTDTSETKVEDTPNVVDHPLHYSGKVECIDAIQSALTSEEFAGFCKGNIVKYVWRASKKGSTVENLEKAEWYLKKLIENSKTDSK